MEKDKAIEEIRKVRHEISEEFKHDTKAILKYYKNLEEKYKDRIIKKGLHASE